MASGVGSQPFVPSSAQVANADAAQSQGELYELWCLIDGEKSPFKVKLPATLDVSDLKDLIREKGIDVQHAKDLSLWKVSTTLRHLLVQGHPCN
jgi:Crinkler effector protein N-terminal domain